MAEIRKWLIWPFMQRAVYMAMQQTWLDNIMRYQGEVFKFTGMPNGALVPQNFAATVVLLVFPQRPAGYWLRDQSVLRRPLMEPARGWGHSPLYDHPRSRVNKSAANG